MPGKSTRHNTCTAAPNNSPAPHTPCPTPATPAAAAYPTATHPCVLTAQSSIIIRSSDALARIRKQRQRLLARPAPAAACTDNSPAPCTAPPKIPARSPPAETECPSRSTVPAAKSCASRSPPFSPRRLRNRRHQIRKRLPHPRPRLHHQMLPIKRPLHRRRHLLLLGRSSNPASRRATGPAAPKNPLPQSSSQEGSRYAAKAKYMPGSASTPLK